jgi:rare lipoprotein A
LRTDGTPAPLPGGLSMPSTMVADATPPTHPTPTAIQAPEVKPVAAAGVLAQAGPVNAAPIPASAPVPVSVASLNMAFMPLPPTRPRSSDGILGKTAAPALGSIGQVNLAKAKIPTPPSEPSMNVEPAAQAFAAAPALLPTIIPMPPVAASMGQ